MDTRKGSPIQRAGFVSRLAAIFVDAIILAVALRSTAWFLDGTSHILRRFSPPVSFGPLIVACAPAVVAIYFVSFWTTFGKTPGKWLLGLEVTPVGGGRLTFKRSLVRLLGYVLSALPLYLGFLWILGPERRGWHDRLARTEVAYVRRHVTETSTADELRRRMRGFRPERSAAFRRVGPARASRVGSRP